MPGRALLWDRGEVLEGKRFVKNRMGQLVLWSRGRVLEEEWVQGCSGDQECRRMCKDCGLDVEGDAWRGRLNDVML